MKKLYTLLLCLALLVLAACSDNLFGSSSPNKDDSVKSLRIDAENAFRRGDYDGSYAICKKILAKDSTSSFGYFGMAKSSLWRHGVNPLNIFTIVKPEKGQCPFMDKTAKEQNDYFQAMKEVADVLFKLNRRDSLTELYDSLTYAIKNGKELTPKVSEFRTTYCKNNTTDCTDKVSGGSFPLSDREYNSSYFSGILFLSSFSKSFLDLLDTRPKNGCIAHRGMPGIDNPGDPEGPGAASKWEKWGCDPTNLRYDLSISLKCPEGENPTIDTDQILDDIKEELKDYYKDLEKCMNNCPTEDCKRDCNNNIPVPGEIESLNNTVDNFSGAFDEVEDVLNTFWPEGNGQDPSGIRDDIDKYKAYASFYKMGTHIDEDGDGCIDEELLDGLDNDGDGIKNENLRLASTDPRDTSSASLYGKGSINSSMKGNSPYRDSENWKYNKPVLKGIADKICIYNSPPGTPNRSCSLLEGDSLGTVVVLAFALEPNYWITTDLDLKLKVAQDTACSDLKYNLKFRRDSIGGCWFNYDECKFAKYWLRRELASQSVQQMRVHQSCRKYKILECPP